MVEDAEDAAQTKLYIYKGIEPGSLKGKRGKIEAVDVAGARHAATRLGLVAVKVEEMPSGRTSFGGGLARGTEAERLEFLRSLAMTSSAVPAIVDALEITVKQVSKRSKLRASVDSLLEAVTSGAGDVAAAFRQQSAVWGADVAEIVAAGIESGDLSTALETLSENKERTGRIKKKVRKIFTKPILMLVLVFGLVWYSVVKVIPGSLEILEDLGGDVPGTTRLALSMGGFFTTFGLPITVVSVVLALLYVLGSRSERYGVAIAAAMMKIPVAGRVLHGQAICVAAGVMSLCVTAGLTGQQSLELTGRAVANKRVKKALADANADHESGTPLDQVMERQMPELPPQFHTLAQQQILHVPNVGGRWRDYAQKVSVNTEKRVDGIAETSGVFIQMGILVVATFISLAAMQPSLNAMFQVMSNPSGLSTNPVAAP